MNYDISIHKINYYKLNYFQSSFTLDSDYIEHSLNISYVSSI